MTVQHIDQLKAIAVFDFLATPVGMGLNRRNIEFGGIVSVEEFFDKPEFIAYFEQHWIPEKEKRGILMRTLEGLYVFGPTMTGRN